MPVPAPMLPDEAIVIGIGRYPKFPAGELPGAVFDATQMADWLVKSAKANVTLITSTGMRNGVSKERFSAKEARPHWSDVNNRIAGYAAAGKGQRGRRLYIFMAGHGFAPGLRKLALITADAEGDNFLPNIEATAWAEWFAAQTYFDEVVLWMDCCATSTFEFDGGQPLMRKTAARQGGRAKVFSAVAARPSRSAFEGKYGPNGEIMGLFTSRLLRGLEGAAADANHNVTSASLIAYLNNPLGMVGPKTQGTADDTERLEPNFIDRDDMVFASGVALPSYRLLTSLPDGTQVEILDGTRNFVGSFKVKKGAVNVRLPTGFFKLAGGGFSTLFEIAAGTGSDVKLS